MNVQQPDHSTYREWLYLEPDGELNAGQRSGLKQHLATCGSCRTERQELASLTRLLDESKISVRASFSQEVMADLPAAGWETRSPKTWLAAMVVVLLLAVGASVLISGAGFWRPPGRGWESHSRTCWVSLCGTSWPLGP